MTARIHGARPLAVATILLIGSTTLALLDAQVPAAPQPPAAARPAAPAASQPAAPAVPEYRIGPEDVLEIVVWKNDQLTRTVPVRPDGKISLPMLTDVQAASLTPTELRDDLVGRYAKWVAEPDISVIVREIHSIKVSVLGAVKEPGRYELRSQARILDAIAMAKGVTDFAKKDRLFVQRTKGNETIRIPFNYARVFEWGDERNFILEAGDVVLVP